MKNPVKGLEKREKGIIKKKGIMGIKNKKIELHINRQEREIRTLKEAIQKKDLELEQLKEQLRYKNQQLASKDIEMESYRKIAEEKIFHLQAKLKELEAKLRK